MKPQRSFLLNVALVSSFISYSSSLLPAATTINAANRHAYGANLGWLDGRGDTTSGAVIGEFICSGYLYAANVGWIHLGGGTAANGIQYQNNSGTDYGVNHDGLGNLRGYAYAANIGWVNFETNGAPRVNLLTGVLSGSVYSANCGWISLSNTFAYVQTDTIAAGGDSDGDGMADAWEFSRTNTLAAFTSSSDADGDGAKDKAEYLADTNPTDATDRLVVTDYLTTSGGTQTTLTWKTKPTRFYYLQKTLQLNPPLWLDSGLGLITPDGASTMRIFGDTNAPMRYYRVRAVKPLTP